MLITTARLVCSNCGFVARQWNSISRSQATIWGKANGWHNKYDADICPLCWTEGKRFS